LHIGIRRCGVDDFGQALGWIVDADYRGWCRAWRWDVVDLFSGQAIGLPHGFGGLGLVFQICRAAGAEALEFVQGAVNGALESRAVERNLGQGIGAPAVRFDHDREAITVIELLEAFEVVLHLYLAGGKEARLDVIEAAQLPRCHGDLADDGFLSRGGRLVLGFDRIEQFVELGWIFPFKDESAGGESMLEAVEANGGAAFGRLRARAFLRVELVGCDLFVGCHWISDVGFRIWRRLFGLRTFRFHGSWTGAAGAGDLRRRNGVSGWI
jgi:hypothetical protein